MAVIEGVGDEVTLLFGALLLLAVLLLAWVSTRTCEPPHLSGPAPPAAAGPAPQDTPPADSPEGAPPAPPPQEEAGGAQRNMVVRLKFLNDTERTAQVQPEDTIGYIKRTYFAGQEQQVRLIYRGQLLQDFQTLASLQLGHNGVLHCHVAAAAAGAGGGGPRPAGPPPALSLGGLMVPLLGLMLAVLWYCQIQYRHFFSAPASASLVGVTLFLSLLAFGVYRR